MLSWVAPQDNSGGPPAQKVCTVHAWCGDYPIAPKPLSVLSREYHGQQAWVTLIANVQICGSFTGSRGEEAGK